MYTYFRSIFTNFTDKTINQILFGLSIGHFHHSLVYVVAETIRACLIITIRAVNHQSTILIY